MVSTEKFDKNGVADLIARIKKTDPTFDAKPEDFGFVGDGRKSDAKALLDYKTYLSALSAATGAAR